MSNRWHLCCTKVFFDIWEMIMPLLPKLMLLWRQNSKSKFCVWLLGQKRRKWKKKQQRRGWRETLWRPVVVWRNYYRTKTLVFFHIVLQYFCTPIFSLKTQTSFSSVVESKNNKWNLQSRVVLITLCFRFFRACRIIKSVSNSQKEVSKKTQRHEQKRRVTKQKSDEKPEK